MNERFHSAAIKLICLSFGLLSACSGSSIPAESAITEPPSTISEVCCINGTDSAASTPIGAVGDYAQLFSEADSVGFVEITVSDPHHATLKAVQETYKGTFQLDSVLNSNTNWVFPEWDGSLYMLLFVGKRSDGTLTVLNTKDPATYDVGQMQREVPPIE